MANKAKEKGSGQTEAAAAVQKIEETLEMIKFPPLMLHVALVLFVGWIAALWNMNLPFVFTLGFLHLFYIEKRQRLKQDMKTRHDERRVNDKKRLLSDAETGRWLNNVVETIWPIFMQKFASEHFLMRLAPYFLEKFKPWTAKKIVLQQLYLGKNPPVLTFFRAGRHPTDGDQLVLEMLLSFSAASDMRASMAVQMKKRVGLGLSTSIHISNVQVEGKVKVGVRFVNGWPVIGRLRICFSEAPIVRMVAKPVFSYGVDVADFPGIAAWLDKMIVDALEQSLVEPQMLVVDVEKLLDDILFVKEKVAEFKKTTGCAGKEAQQWYCIERRPKVATLVVEILEAEKLKRCDPNGKADPYVKMVVGQSQYSTSVRKKTLSPSWYENFRLPIASWENSLLLVVRDKDRFRDDDEMGYKKVPINEVRGGERHDMWLLLDGVKTGKLHVALTVEEVPPSEENIGLESPQVDDALPRSSSMNDGSISSQFEVPGGSARSDILETPGKIDRSSPVDVGVGPPGCVSIVSPGKEVVRESSFPVKPRQRKKISKELAQMEKENEKAREAEAVDPGSADAQNPNAEGDPKKFKRSIWPRRGSSRRSGKYQDELVEGAEDAEPADSSPVESQGASVEADPKLSKRRNLWSRRGDRTRSDVSPDGPADEFANLLVVGDRGTELHMTVDPPEVRDESSEDHGLECVSMLTPEFGENHDKNLDEGDKHVKRDMVRKQATKMFKQAGKTANHTLRKFHSVKGDRGLIEMPLSDDDISTKEIENGSQRDIVPPTRMGSLPRGVIA